MSREKKNGKCGIIVTVFKRSGKADEHYAHKIEKSDPERRIPAKQACCRFDTDDGIRFAILTSIDGVIPDGPADQAEIEKISAGEPYPALA